MNMIQLTIGHNVQGVPTLSIQAVCEAVEAFLDIEAYTAIPCYGMWKGEAETSTRIEIVADDDTLATIRANVQYLTYALAQESIMCTYQGTTEFIGPHTPAIARLAC